MQLGLRLGLTAARGAVGGSPAAALRGVSAYNSLGLSNTGATNVAGREDSLSHAMHVIGGGTVNEIVMSFNNWALGGAGASGIIYPGNAYRILEAWLTHSSGAFVAVTVGGNASFDIAIGANDVQSDPITPADLGLADFPMGAAFAFSARWTPIDSGGTRIVGGTVASAQYANYNTTPKATAPLDTYPSSKLRAFTGLTSNTGWGAGGSEIPVVMLGKYAGAEPPTFLGVADSMFTGVGDATTAQRARGLFGRCMVNDFTTPTAWRAGIMMAKSGTDARLYDVAAPNDPQAMLTHWAGYTTVLLERYGGNNRSYPSQYTAKRVIWDLFKAAPRTAFSGTPKIVLIAITGATTSTDSWATLVNQTISTGCGPGSGSDLINQECAGDVGVDVDGYIDDLAVHGDPNPANNDYWRWAVSPAVTTGDGLHANAVGYELMAGEVRTYLISLGL
jgi:hypothetical protein